MNPGTTAGNQVHHSALRLLVATSLLLALWQPVVVDAAGDEDTIDVLFLCGNSWFSGRYRRDLLMEVDPAIDVLAVQTVAPFDIWNKLIQPDQVNRKLRIYMPRTYEQLLGEHDLVVLHDVCHAHPQEAGVLFDRKWINWFVEGVKEEGLCVSMWGGDCCWGGQGEQINPSWEETTLDEILPFNSIGGYNPSQFAGSYLKPRFVDPGNPLLRLPWDTCPGIAVLNRVSPRQGATLVAEAVSSRAAYPWIAWWRYGQGISLGETQVFYSVGGGGRMQEEWEWWQDFVIYLTYFGAGKEIPEDIYRAHRLRNEINTHITQKSMLVSLLEFVENFGARTVPLYDELASIDAVEQRAEEHYRKGEYEATSDLFEEIHLAWELLNVKAIELKERTLAWIYIIEWLVVTGVAAASGTLLWSLMVRRRFYKGVMTTRLA